MSGEIVINLMFLVGILLFMGSITCWVIDLPENIKKEEEV